MGMKEIIGLLFIAAGVIAGIYVGGWVLFVHPILEACKAFDAGTLTGTIVGTTIIKCVFAGAVGSILAWIGCALGSALLN